jgi:DIS3-like exonuclease 2
MSERKQQPRTPQNKHHNNNNNNKNNTPHSAGKSPSSHRRPIFESYVEAKQLTSTNLRGILRIQSKDKAFVSVPGLVTDVLLTGREARNRAYDGDTVALAIDADRSTWRWIGSGSSHGDDVDDNDTRTSTVVVEDPAVASLGGGIAALSLADAAVSSDEESNNDQSAINAATTATVDLGRIVALLHDSSAEAGSLLVNWLNSAVNARGERLQVSARVIFIEKRERAVGDLVVGFLRTRRNDLDVDPNDQFYLFVPSDQKLPTMLVLGTTVPREFKETPKLFEARIVAVRVLDWKETSFQPLATFHEVIGDSFNIVAETRALLMQYQVNDRPHSKEAIACLPQVGDDWQPSAEQLANRRDFRKECVVTIDPPTARDLDDALHIKRLENGNVEMGVHIADVTAFLSANCALDIEAQQRATTFYLNERAIPMLPRLLSDNLCSLHPNVDRLTFSVVWEMTTEGHIVSEWFGHSVIRSCSKMAYGVAQAMIDGQLKHALSDAFTADELTQFPAVGPYDGHTVEAIVADVLLMNEIATQLRKRRFDSGALALHNVKLSFKCDARNVPISAQPYELKEANHMIEEYMLLANHRVALKIVSALPKSSLLRNHVPPAPRAMEKFTSFVLEATGVTLNSETSLTLGRSLAELRTAVSPEVFTALQDMGTRPMQLAKYFSTGELPEPQWHHYGLNMGHYTHFTSPIRRYADVIVHRQLNAALAIDEAHGDVQAAKLANERVFHELLGSLSVQLHAEHSNVRKLAARKVQEGQHELLLCLMLRDKPAVCTGVVVGLGDRFLSVFIGQYGVTERVYMQDHANLNGWIWNDNKLSNEESFALGEQSTLVLQWALEYDPNAPTFATKEAVAAASGADQASEAEALESGAADADDEFMRDVQKRATALAEQDERDAQLQDKHMHAAGRRNRQRAAHSRNGGKANGDDNGGKAGGDEGEREGHRPSQLPSIEQRLRLLDTITVQLGMRKDVKRASLRALALHPHHPEVRPTQHVHAVTNRAEQEYENIDI